MSLHAGSRSDGAGTRPASRPATAPSGAHERLTLHGFPVMLDRRLRADGDLCGAVLAELENQYYQIGRALPRTALGALRDVVTWVEAESQTLCMAYHPSREWLLAHEFNSDFAGGIEVGHPRNFLAWTREQPWMVLHELAHAYHDRVLSVSHPELLDSYKKAKESKKYDSILHVNGRRQRHYAMENVNEYFAELSEAYFGTNDMYPFVRGELSEFDPEAFALLGRLWGAR
jgi:hypothetical protein